MLLFWTRIELIELIYTDFLKLNFDIDIAIDLYIVFSSSRYIPMKNRDTRSDGSGSTSMKELKLQFAFNSLS